MHREFLDFGTDVEELVAEVVLAVRSGRIRLSSRLVAGCDALGRAGRRDRRTVPADQPLYQPVAVDFREGDDDPADGGRELKHIG